MDAILFIHHRPLCEPVTKKHLALIRMMNPDAEVFPLCFDSGREDTDWQWRNCDLLVYEWFVREQPKHERFFIIEWDTLCTMSLKDFYGSSYNKPAVGARIITPWSHELLKDYEPRKQTRQRDWHFFEHNTSPEIYPYLRGVTPMCGVMLKRNILSSMVELWSAIPGFKNLFCECRIATLACMAGFEMQEIRPDYERFIHYEDVTDWDVPGIYHRVRA